jgi:myosin-5
LQIINAMGGQIERQQDNNACLAYWLSNTVTLLYLLQRNIKPASGGAYNARLRSPTSRSPPPHHTHGLEHLMDWMTIL